ncbi:MAG: DMT family transporter [Acidimicrobiia bacterium]
MSATAAYGRSRLKSASLSARLPLMAVCVAIFAWGLGPIAVRSASVSGLTVAMWRFIVSIPIVLVANKVSGTKIRWADIKRTFTVGVLFGASIVPGFVSFRHTSIANATLIPALMPAIVLFVAPKLFGDRITRREIGWAILSFVGIGLVVFGAGHTTGAGRYGDFLAVVNLVLFVGYFLEVKRLRETGLSPITIVTGTVTWSLLFVVPFALLVSDDVWQVTGLDWVRIVFVALVPGFLGHSLMAYAQRSIDVSVSSLLTLANPVISTIGAWMILGQSMRAVQVAGAVVLLGALAAIVLERRLRVPVDDLEPI